MNARLADALYTILIEECGAAPALRADFARWFQSRPATGYRLSTTVFQRGGTGGQWRVSPASHVQIPGRSDAYHAALAERCACANQRLSDLACALNRLSPVERLDWLNAQEPQS